MPTAASSVTTIAVLVSLGALLRVVAYPGFMGSDDVVYLKSAYRLLEGDWTVERYVGANRLGVNLPMAAFGWAFGRSELAAAMYGVLTSLAEIALVVWFAARVFDLRAAALTGLLMATLPIHVHTAGRIVADPALSLAITAAFVLFFEAERLDWTVGYFWAGLCAGLSFWIKPPTLFVFAVLLLWPFVVRRWNWRWLAMPAGLLAGLAANGVLMWALTGNFWFVFDMMRQRRQSGYLEEGAMLGAIADAPYFYLEYLFARIYHTGMLGILAAAGLLILLLQGSGRATSPSAARYVVLWGAGLFAILSLLPVSLDPLLFVPKQTNYMLIFAAPLCLTGGYALSRLSRASSCAVALAACLLGVGLSLLLQASIRSFTANSAATLEYIAAQPAGVFHVMTNAHQAADFQREIGGRDLLPRIGASALDVASGRAPVGAAATQPHWVIVDPETLQWDSARPLDRLQDAPACWQLEARLQGRPTGAGVWLVRELGMPLSRMLPFGATAVGTRLRGLVEPQQALVYRVPAGACR